MYNLFKCVSKDRDNLEGRKFEEDFPEPTIYERYPIVSNGTRFKKDSRRWLHKKSNKTEVKSKESVEVMVDPNNEKDSCNGANDKTTTSIVETILKTDSYSEAQDQILKSNIGDFSLEENANCPEMFRRKNKRRMKSPSTGNQCAIRFDECIEAKLRNFLTMSNTFKPIKPEDTSDQSGNNTENIVTSEVIDQGGESRIWRQSKIVLSDGSTTPSLSQSPPTSPRPVKRSKTLRRDAHNTITSCDSTPSELDFEDTPRGSPWISLSLQDSFLLNWTVSPLDGQFSKSDENCNN